MIREEFEKSFESYITGWANNFERELARKAMLSGAKWMAERCAKHLEDFGCRNADPNLYIASDIISKLAKGLDQ
jgi:hypothetical protein